MSRDRRRANRISRRVFIHRLAFFGGGVVLIGPACKREKKEGPRSRQNQAEVAPAPDHALKMSPHGTFTLAEFAALSAACSRLIPTDDDPGAIEANVPTYVDRMLQTPEMRRIKNLVVGGTVLLERQSQKMFGKGFADATPEQQDDLLRIFKDSTPESGEGQYFEALIVLTLEGLLGNPSYGGNKDRVGWALVGFGTSEPPLGHSHGAN